MSCKLVLFDVDGTLIVRRRRTGSLHADAFSAAFRKVFGIDAHVDEFPSLAGRTDRKIIIEITRMKGLDEKAVRPKIRQACSVMVKHFENNIKNDSSYGEIPHARELLTELEKQGCILGLVTGNVERIAELKLKKFGLLDFFKAGAFGDSSENRSELVAKAIRNAGRKFKIKIEKKDVFVVGDTMRDIEGGKEAGVKTIAMATGPFTLSELKKCKPDYAFADFSEREKIARAIHSD